MRGPAASIPGMHIILTAHDRDGQNRAGSVDMVADISGLTRREQDILRLIADGRTNQEIAGQLVVSVNTVQTHVAHILQKLGVRSRHQAADIWVQRNH